MTNDIKASKLSAVESLAELCQFVVMEEQSKNNTQIPVQANTTTWNNSTFWGNSTANTTAIPPTVPLDLPSFELPAFLAQNLCPGDCNGNGDCVNSTCVCYSNFTSPDCSLRKGIYQMPYFYFYLIISRSV